jgi:hypothetical protein
VVYSAAGTYDASLTASNLGTNSQGTMSKTAFINVNTTPGAPIMPQGNANFCINPDNQTYTITPVGNTTGYTWELTPAAAGTVTPNGTSCTVDYNNTWTGSAQLRVLALNACGNGAWSPTLNITISSTPGTATTPTGPASLCMNAPNTDYTTTGTPPATSYQWELVPADAGALYPNMTTVTIDWVNTFSGPCQLRVKPINGVCEGQWTNFYNITIEAGPTAYNLTGGGAYCGQGGNGSPVGLDGSQTGVNYTLYLDGTATSTVVAGTGSAISFGNQMTAGNYTVQAGSAGAGCPNTMNGSSVVTIDPQVPNVPSEPIGPEHVYTGATPTSEYNTVGGTYATTYSWDITPASAGTITGISTIGTVTWDPSYAGDASIRVKGVNSCGGGTFSTEYTVTVDVGVGMTEPTRTKLISIYPNPARESVTIIPARNLNADLQVYNSLGETLISKSALSLTGNYQLDISNLKTGIYFVRVNSEGAQQILKLIVE